ncbi:MAG: hypothetical protein RIA64_01780 [Rhodospirillales bacterium]
MKEDLQFGRVDLFPDWLELLRSVDYDVDRLPRADARAVYHGLRMSNIWLMVPRRSRRDAD